MEALSGSQSLEGLIQSRKVAKWAGCSAKTFADAVVARLETLCETESYKADVLGRKAEVVGFPVGPVSPVGSYSLDTLDLLPGLYSGVLCACNGKKGGPVCTEFTGFTSRH